MGVPFGRLEGKAVWRFGNAYLTMSADDLTDRETEDIRVP